MSKHQTATQETAMSAITPEMQEIIGARVHAIICSHTNNLISGIDMGEEAFNAMLERAKVPISDEEFVLREKEIIHKEYAERMALHEEFSS